MNHPVPAPEAPRNLVTRVLDDDGFEGLEPFDRAEPFR